MFKYQWFLYTNNEKKKTMLLKVSAYSCIIMQCFSLQYL